MDFLTPWGLTPWGLAKLLLASVGSVSLEKPD